MVDAEDFDAEAQELSGEEAACFGAACLIGEEESADFVEVSEDIPAASHYFYKSVPEPPADLWDTSDAEWLYKAACDVSIRVSSLEPKNNTFGGTMRLLWKIRVPKEDSPKLEDADVDPPKVRFPGLETEFTERRMWKEKHPKTAVHSDLWMGVTKLTFSGSQMFDIRDFPFDRQILDLELFDVREWHSSQITVVSLEVKTTPLLAQWRSCGPDINIKNECVPAHGAPTGASRFLIGLRLQRIPNYYINNIILVSTGITIACLFVLVVPPSKIGTRLELYFGGLLTLVAFKFGISESLPSVPYNTVADKILLSQLLCLISLAIEAALGYLLDAQERLHDVELSMMGVALVFWLCWKCFLVACKKPRPWDEVKCRKERREHRDPDV
jgi:hypothetical protein